MKNPPAFQPTVAELPRRMEPRSTAELVDDWLHSRVTRTQAHVYRFPAGTDQEQISKRETREAIDDFCSTLQPEVAEAVSEFQGDEPPGRHVPKNVRSSRIGWGVMWLAFLAACAYLGLS